MSEPVTAVDEDEDDEPPTLVPVDPRSFPSASHEPQRSSSSSTTGLGTSTTCCPVTILSGFLGSGKSTLVQYILKSPDHGKRIAVVENEFGAALQIESLIVRDGVNDNASLADLIELPNGCVCCTVKDSLVATLEGLLNKRSDLDYILIECSGMANPGPVAAIFWLDEALESRLRLDGIVTVVDAAHIEQQLAETEEAAQQIAYADRILLNKVDLLIDGDKAGAVDRLMQTIRQIQPLAPVLTTSYSQVPDLHWVLDAHCFDEDRFADVEKLMEVRRPQVNGKCTSHALQHPHHHHDGEQADHCPSCSAEFAAHSSAGLDNHRHTGSISSVFLLQGGTVDLDRMNKWLASLLWPNQDQTDKVLRANLEEAMAHHKSLDGSVDMLPPNPSSSLSAIVPVQQIFRIKGVLSVRHPATLLQLGAAREMECDLDANGIDRRRYIVQGVHDLWEIHPASATLNWGDNEERLCKVVIIGRFMNEDDLRGGFQSCFP